MVQLKAQVERNAPLQLRQQTQHALEDLLHQSLYHLDSKVPRKANLSNLYGDYIRSLAYQHFLETGSLLPPSQLPSTKYSDEEYLMGIIGVNQDLARYVIGRATDRDVLSVIMARDLVDATLSHLMLYDFRNGNLRRRYDAVKYALKTCETVLYELSVTGSEIPTNTKKDNSYNNDDDDEGGVGEEDGPSNVKRRKVGSTTTGPTSIVPLLLLPQQELQELHQRMEHRDELRETLIKKCRDAQKAAKNAIYCLHREDITKAKSLIESCENIVLMDLMPIVEEEPMLRYGSFANVLEEYAEARLFYVWLVGNKEKEEPEGIEEDASSSTVSVPSGQILSYKDFNRIALEPEEYLGGLCDLTGEIGRYAVKRGTFRDEEQVSFCLTTVMNVLYGLESLEKLPGGIGKKMGPLRSAVEKIEKMMYELSLTKATGRNVKADLEDMTTNTDHNEDE